MTSQTHSTASVRTDQLGNPPLSLSEASSPAYTRLVVLVPVGAIDYKSLYQALSRLVIPSVCEIVYVGLGQDRSSSPVARHLAELTFMGEELSVYQRSRIIDAASWAEAVPKVVQPGDLIVCQKDRRGGRLVEQLSEVTASPVHALPGLQLSLSTRLEHAMKSLLFNLFPLAVVAAFFWLQVQIDAANTGLTRTLVLSMTVLVELGVIFVWSLFIR